MQWGIFGTKSRKFIKRPLHKDARINILTGSVRSGKTVTMIPKWLHYIKNGPPGLLIMTGVSKDTIMDNVLNDIFDTVGTANYKYNRNSGDLTVYGRRIKVLGAKDEGSEKYLRGKTLAGAYCDEMSLMPETFFKQLLNRLSVTGAKLYATTNPDTPSHYLYTDYIINTEKQKSGLIDVITYGLDDNPSLDDEYKKYIRQAYQGVWHLRMILGKWVSAEGAIFDMWGEKENMYDEMPLGLKSLCRRNISIDYGTTNPMIFCDFFDDGNNIWLDRLYCWDSRKKNRQKTDSQYADDLIEFIGDERPDYIIIDPSAASFKAELHQRGLRIKDADNEVLDGLRMMATLIAQRRLKVNRQCKEFKTEIEGYVWDEKARKLGKEQPLKEGDHVMDACRYFVKTMLRAWRLGK